MVSQSDVTIGCIFSAARTDGHKAIGVLFVLGKGVHGLPLGFRGDSILVGVDEPTDEVPDGQVIARVSFGNSGRICQPRDSGISSRESAPSLLASSWATSLAQFSTGGIREAWITHPARSGEEQPVASHGRGHGNESPTADPPGRVPATRS